MSYIYLGNQKSALNKAFMNDNVSDYITVGLCYVTAETYKEANDDLSVYSVYSPETAEAMFDNNVETYYDGQYLNFHSSKGNIKEVVLDVQSNYWDNGIEVWGANDDNREIGMPTTNMGYWEVIGTLPIGYGERKIVTYTLDETYKYLAFAIDRKWIYSMKIKVE